MHECWILCEESYVLSHETYPPCMTINSTTLVYTIQIPHHYNTHMHKYTMKYEMHAIHKWNKKWSTISNKSSVCIHHDCCRHFCTSRSPPQVPTWNRTEKHASNTSAAIPMVKWTSQITNSKTTGSTWAVVFKRLFTTCTQSHSWFLDYRSFPPHMKPTFTTLSSYQ